MFFSLIFPSDQELHNAIDKVAQCIAPNGPEFEHMTMEEQKDNAFLFGGEYSATTKYKLPSNNSGVRERTAAEHKSHLFLLILNLIEI